MTDPKMPPNVRVKPLVWHKSHITPWNGDWHTVPTGYAVRCADENGWKWATSGGFGYSSSDTGAKLAAQRDHEARILSALEVVEDEATIRREPMISAIAALSAAISLLERGGKKAAASDKIFDQMLNDYRKALNEARAALTKGSTDDRT